MYKKFELEKHLNLLQLISTPHVWFSTYQFSTNFYLHSVLNTCQFFGIVTVCFYYVCTIISLCVCCNLFRQVSINYPTLFPTLFLIPHFKRYSLIIIVQRWMNVDLHFPFPVPFLFPFLQYIISWLEKLRYPFDSAIVISFCLKFTDEFSINNHSLFYV